MIDKTEFTRWYVYDSLYMSALAKLKNYLNRLNYIGLIEHMNTWMEIR